MLKLELKEGISELRKLKARKIFLQIPEGLKINTEELIDELEKEGFEVATSMDPCFGACDLKQKEALELKCDAILHIGHTKFVYETRIPTVYVSMHYELGKKFDKICEMLSKRLEKEKIKAVGIVTTTQYKPYLEGLQKYLEKKGIEAVIGKGRRAEDGQVLGCNYSSAIVKPDTIVYLGDGLFHPLGIHFATMKKVLIANPLQLEINTLKEEKDAFLRRRITLIEQTKEASDIGIIVSTKDGQQRLTNALSIKKELEKAGKHARIYTMDFVSNNTLLGIKAQALINTACPRISIDDNKNYRWPMINMMEVPYLLGKKSYDEYMLEAVY